MHVLIAKILLCLLLALGVYGGGVLGAGLVQAEELRMPVEAGYAVPPREPDFSLPAAAVPSALPTFPVSSHEVVVPTIPPIWHPLLTRLAADGISGPDVDAMFASLGNEASQDPMGRKVRELYVKNFLRTPPDPNAPKKAPLRLYKGVVTAANAELCKAFLAQNALSFARAHQRYGVPPEIAVALLFVETRLGTSMGQERALYTLASMAQSTTPDAISTWFPKLPGYEDHLDWMQDLMPKRADWAYRELRALVVHLRTQGLEVSTVPGSIYGAVGMCQFMPSNLVPYGADGDDDGVIDLFTVPDAVESLSNYLSKHGWKPGIGRAGQHAALKSYNRVDIYANTIMALADLIAGRSLPLPTDTQTKKQKKRTTP